MNDMEEQTTTTEAAIKHRSDGQIESKVETVRDIATKEVIRSTETGWTYYPTGEVDTITIVENDADGKGISRKEVKHFLDGRQPEETVK
jgi:hypothetical protein